MSEIITFNGVLVSSIEPEDIEKEYEIHLKGGNENIPLVFPSINKSLCSCEKINVNNIDITHFQIANMNEIGEQDYCAICQKNQLDICISCEMHGEKIDKCPTVKSISCNHKFHYCCIQRWLSCRMICPICAIDWKFVGSGDNKMTVYYDNMVEEFDVTDNIVEEVGNKFGIDMTKYKITKNKSYVDEYKNGKYGICTPDMHSSHSALSIFCEMGDKKKNLIIKYSTTIEELRDMISNQFGLFPDQVGLTYDGVKISKDFYELTVFNINIKNETTIYVDINNVSYSMDIKNNFLVIYPENEPTGNTIQNIVTGRSSWLGYPYIKNPDIKGLSCLLSSLYILIKKVNTDEDMIKAVLDKFEKYMILYHINDQQIKLAKYALQGILNLDNKTDFDKRRTVLVLTFHELIYKIRKTCNEEIIENVLMSSNVLCNLLLSNSKADIINWKYAIKDMHFDKIFNIYSPLVLINGVPPLLTLNEDLNIVVFVGKCKDISLPNILFNPLTGGETDANSAELAKKIGDKGEVLLVDDRVYDEGIMVCIDTSNSMSGCSNFSEDIETKEKDALEDRESFYKILETKQAYTVEENDIRDLKNTVIWFITHPNFNDWIKNRNNNATVANIVCCEQKTNLKMATLMVKYNTIFRKLLENKVVDVGGKYYSHLFQPKKVNQINKKYKTEPPSEYLCPITLNIMENPVIAKDGFSYEKDAIEKWFNDHNTSPITRKKISNKVINNNVLKFIIRDWEEKNIIKEDSEVNTLTLNLGDELGNLVFEYDNSNVWDLIYEIYKMTGYTNDKYELKNGYYVVTNRDQLIKNIADRLTFQIGIDEDIDIKIQKSYYTLDIKVPHTYKVINIIYKLQSGYYEDNEYQNCQIWENLKESGDGILRGLSLSNDTRIIYHKESKLSFFSNERLYLKKRNYMSRLDIVKKLFDAFVNRSIAYSFNTGIGLMSFSDTSKSECEMTPFYESFRDKKDELRADGGTALMEALTEAANKLIAWRDADKEKRKNAKLRVICLTDGKDTSSKKITEYDIKKIFGLNNIILDCVVIGSEYDKYLGSISNVTGGYTFNPSTIKHAFDIMELETMISSKDRDKIAKYRYNGGMVPEGETPPMIKPIDSLNSKSLNIDKALGKFTNSVKILYKELKMIQENPHPEIDVFINDDDIFFWKVLFSGPDGTPYKGGCWLAYVQFPQTYPLVAPNIRFVTPIKHCNINNYGRVCHSILDRNYTPNVGISMILQCIYGLLLNPDVSDPLDTNLALSFYEANGAYETDIIEHVNKYAKKIRKEWKI